MGMRERLELERALEQHFERKRMNFLEGYGLLSKPALILQCVPDEPLPLDLASEPLVDAIRGGGGPEANDGWWHGLKNGDRPCLTFEGLSTRRRSFPEDWASEVHADGSLIVGVWKFPPSSSFEPDTVPGVGVGDFYVQLFKDFAYLASKVYEAVGYSGMAHITCTMHFADKLPLVNGHGQMSVPASKRSTLRWPIATVDGMGMPAVGEAMAAQFMRIYGWKYRK